MMLKLSDAEANELRFCLRAIRNKTHKELNSGKTPPHWLRSREQKLARIDGLLRRLRDVFSADPE